MTTAPLQLCQPTSWGKRHARGPVPVQSQCNHRSGIGSINQVCRPLDLSSEAWSRKVPPTLRQKLSHLLGRRILLHTAGQLLRMGEQGELFLCTYIPRSLVPGCCTAGSKRACPVEQRRNGHLRPPCPLFRVLGQLFDQSRYSQLFWRRCNHKQHHQVITK